MSEYIKREDAERLLRYSFLSALTEDERVDEINRVPSADVVEVRHGRWIELAMKGEYKCSVCGRGSKSENTFQLIPEVYWNYCPNCGAKMDGK